MKTQKNLVDIDVNVKNVLQFLTALDYATSGRSFMKFLTDDAADFFRDDIESRFYEEGDVKSGFWPPLAETTERIREQLGFGGAEPILRRTDDLFNFLTGDYQIFGSDSWAEMQVPGDPPDPLTARKLEVATKGTNVNPRFPGAITPPRPPLAVSEADLGKLLGLLMIHITEQIVLGIDLG